MNLALVSFQMYGIDSTIVIVKYGSVDPNEYDEFRIDN
jgi:hypothetical protein